MLQAKYQKIREIVSDLEFWPGWHIWALLSSRWISWAALKEISLVDAYRLSFYLRIHRVLDAR
jgi:hypothetical protein